MDIENEDIQEHAIFAYYAGGPGDPYYQPALECSCGFSTGRSCSWEDAGVEFDAHRKFVGEIK